MQGSEWVGKILVLTGMIIAGVGLVAWLGPRIPWIGRLPGDIVIQRNHIGIYVPLATGLVLSVLLTILLNLLMRR